MSSSYNAPPSPAMFEFMGLIVKWKGEMRIKVWKGNPRYLRQLRSFFSMPQNEERKEGNTLEYVRLRLPSS